MGQAGCLPCPGGTLCPDQGTVTPTVCGTGSYCPPASKHSVLCPIGTFSSRSGLANETECVQCTGGKYCARQGLTAPTGDCDAGFFCSNGSSLPNPVALAFGDISPKGFYAPAGSAQPMPCPAGTYNPSEGKVTLSDCISCDVGHFCNSSGLAAPTGVCPAGFVCVGGAITGLERPVLVGTYALAGSNNATQCPPGSFASAPAAGSCALSPAGFAAPGFGTVIPQPCSAGYWCTGNSTSLTQNPCPAGRFSNETGLSDPSQCTLCTAGYYCATPGLLAPTGPCAGGWYCSPGSDSMMPGF
jgi:hypothetical protein